MTRRVILALGANLGDRAATIESALRDLDARPEIAVVAGSRVYETPALTLTGIDDTEPRYLNACALLEVAETLSARALLDVLRALEDESGRQRQVRWGSRTLDLDIVDFGGLEQSTRVLTLPHPRAGDRAFVLAPWMDLEPDAVLAGRGPIAELRAAAADRVDPVGRIVVDREAAEAEERSVRVVLDGAAGGEAPANAACGLAEPGR
ncbi:2-amino-4-hydroxy-6-hydroxymethyldihydropteridinepyrophosphokinase [Pseudoclavibacter triregionum]|nr:2-amino-4-hydroxy-6-hydroxymethyldihydropteridinepyrophosphokinase [Pseudoclavibacter triregionum]